MFRLVGPADVRLEQLPYLLVELLELGGGDEDRGVAYGRCLLPFRGFGVPVLQPVGRLGEVPLDDREAECRSGFSHLGICRIAGPGGEGRQALAMAASVGPALVVRVDAA